MRITVHHSNVEVDGGFWDYLVDTVTFATWQHPIDSGSIDVHLEPLPAPRRVVGREELPIRCRMRVTSPDGSVACDVVGPDPFEAVRAAADRIEVRLFGPTPEVAHDAALPAAA